jgi:hypothetical protein
MTGLMAYDCRHNRHDPCDVAAPHLPLWRARPALVERFAASEVKSARWPA